MTVEFEDDFYKFKCPHCEVDIIVKIGETNCKIFRCGIFKSTLQPIPPHLSKPECELLIKQNKIYGCGKPFKMSEDLKSIDICGYI